MTNNLLLGVEPTNGTNLSVPYSMDPGDEQDLTNFSCCTESGYRGGLHALSNLQMGMQNRLEDEHISALTSEMCGQAIAAHEALRKLKL